MSRVRRFLKKVSFDFQDVFFPKDIKCISCEKELDKHYKYSVCNTCADGIFYIKKSCLRCGKEMSNDSDYCISCKTSPPLFEQARAPFVYDGTIRNILIDCKNGNGWLCEYFSEMICSDFPYKGINFDIIIPVPMTKSRKKQRGFNQSELIAKFISEEINVPYNANILLKAKETKKQALLTAKERFENLKNSFTVKKLPNSVKNKNILLVDDILTTGATANECARILKKSGALSVYVITLATSKGK